MSIMPSLPNIFDPNVLLSQKVTRVTDMMGDDANVLIRENMTTILDHRVFFRESVPRANITSNGKTIVLLHDKHTESSGGTGCCSGLWVSLQNIAGVNRFSALARDSSSSRPRRISCHCTRFTWLRVLGRSST